MSKEILEDVAPLKPKQRGNVWKPETNVQLAALLVFRTHTLAISKPVRRPLLPELDEPDEQDAAYHKILKDAPVILRQPSTTLEMSWLKQ